MSGDFTSSSLYSVLLFSCAISSLVSFSPFVSRHTLYSSTPTVHNLASTLNRPSGSYLFILASLVSFATYFVSIFSMYSFFVIFAGILF